jgi:hypothetical protein
MKPLSNLDIIEQVAKEYQIPLHRAKAVIDHYYSALKETLSNAEHREILVHKLGNITMQKGPLRHTIEKKKSIQNDEELKLKLTEHLNKLK